MNVNERSSKTVISTGVIRPAACAVCALNAFVNSTMLTPCWPSAGPTGGAGLAWPPGIWSLIIVRTFFAIRLLAISIDLLHLIEAELHRHLALEDVHEHLQLLRVRVDVDDLAVEVGERPRRHLDRLAQLEFHLRLRERHAGGSRTGVQDLRDLALGERHGLRARTDEPRDPRRSLDDRPGLVGEV